MPYHRIPPRANMRQRALPVHSHDGAILQTLIWRGEMQLFLFDTATSNTLGYLMLVGSSISRNQIPGYAT